MGGEDSVDHYANWLLGRVLGACENLEAKAGPGHLTVFATGKAISPAQQWLFIVVEKRHLDQPRLRCRNLGVWIWPLPRRFVFYPRSANIVHVNLVRVRACAVAASIAANAAGIKVR